MRHYHIGVEQVETWVNFAIVSNPKEEQILHRKRFFECGVLVRNLVLELEINLSDPLISLFQSINTLELGYLFDFDVGWNDSNLIFTDIEVVLIHVKVNAFKSYINPPN